MSFLRSVGMAFSKTIGVRQFDRIHASRTVWRNSVYFASSVMRVGIVFGPLWGYLYSWSGLAIVACIAIGLFSYYVWMMMNIAEWRDRNRKMNQTIEDVRQDIYGRIPPYVSE